MKTVPILAFLSPHPIPYLLFVLPGNILYEYIFLLLNVSILYRSVLAPSKHSLYPIVLCVSVSSPPPPPPFPSLLPSIYLSFSLHLDIFHIPFFFPFFPLTMICVYQLLLRAVIFKLVFVFHQRSFHTLQ